MQKQTAPAATEAVGDFQNTEPVFSTPTTDAPQQFSIDLMGNVALVAQFIYDASPRPVAEISLAAAIAFCAGVFGSAYNVSGTGLNQYVLLIASTGRGKEAIASGISKLVCALKSTIPGIAEFVGPTEIASPQALVKWLARTPCVNSIVGEFGLKLKEMSAPHANANVTGLKRALLDLYNKSGHGSVLGAMAYSKREDNTSVINSPSFTLIGESTPENFYANLNESWVADGFLPRFLIMDYEGPRVNLREGHATARPSRDLLDKLAAILVHVLNYPSRRIAQDVAMSWPASVVFNRFDTFCDHKINSANESVAARELWNRAHVKAMKLAALFAVGCNYNFPCITEEQAQWTTDEVARQTNKLIHRFERGDVGEAEGNEDRQYKAVAKIIAFYATSTFEQCKPYLVPQDMHLAKIIPASFIQRRLVATSPFKGIGGGTAAINRCLQRMLNADELRQIPKRQMIEQYGTSAVAYSISRPELFLDAL